MDTCTSVVDLFVMAFKLQVDCDTLGRSRRIVGGRKLGARLACTTMGFTIPSHPKNLELWIVHAVGYLQRRLPLHGDIPHTSNTDTDTDSWTKLRLLRH
jgi:hypothetical protein